MAHISLPEKLPGILGPMAFRPEAARALGALAETILRGPASLSSAERELIASVVSRAKRTPVSSAASRTRPRPATTTDRRPASSTTRSAAWTEPTFRPK